MLYNGWCESMIFFFSSRRRHTRYWHDWSSDVCSSDLDPTCVAMARSPLDVGTSLPGPAVLGFVACGAVVRRDAYLECDRSEERRVGKECRSRWSPYH